jgi:hypothetical protein
MVGLEPVIFQAFSARPKLLTRAVTPRLSNETRPGIVSVSVPLSL